MERFCRECGAPISGRSDKKFCCDDCRTAWHNRRYYQRQRAMSVVNRILMRNHDILDLIHSAGVRSIRLTDMRLNGFDRRYFTSVEKGLMGPPRYHLYEYTFSIISGRICRIRKG